MNSNQHGPPSVFGKAQGKQAFLFFPPGNWSSQGQRLVLRTPSPAPRERPRLAPLHSGRSEGKPRLRHWPQSLLDAGLAATAPQATSLLHSRDARLTRVRRCACPWGSDCRTAGEPHTLRAGPPRARSVEHQGPTEGPAAGEGPGRLATLAASRGRSPPPSAAPHGCRWLLPQVEREDKPFLPSFNC